eukprot:Amastigsp_a175720_87.p5 type:complete len:170 gc:universal Amastigsp_a175720_87:1793-2302(+)
MRAKPRPVSQRFLTAAATTSTSNGSSGMRMMSAAPAMPAWRAIHPALRPMTSMTSARWCDIAVVRHLSMESTTVCTAVAKPKVWSVPHTSLSMVLQTPMHGKPRRVKLSAPDWVPSPPTMMSAQHPCARSRSRHSSVRSSVMFLPCASLPTITCSGSILLFEPMIVPPS